MDSTAQSARRAKNPRRVAGFCEALGIGRTKFYSLAKDKDLAPLTVKLGRNTFLKESPAEYLERISSGPKKEAA